MSDHHEPSYYEIALTNRQVLAAFVVVLACVLAAFVAGVWVGRDAATPEGEQIASEESRLEDLERLDFFSEGGVGAAGAGEGEETAADDEGARPSRRPDLESLLTKPRTDSTLAEDVGAAGGGTRQKPRRRPQRRAAGAAESPPPTAIAELDEEVAPPPPSAPPAAPPAAPPTADPALAAGEGFVVQVFSTREETRARSVLADLVADGHRAFLAPLEAGAQTMYRVRIGPFRDRASAEKVAVDVNRALKLDTWVTAAGAGD